MSATLIQIARSWFAFAKGEPYTKGLMQKRLAICDLCPEKEELSETGQVLVKVLNDEGSLYRCGKCGCPLAGLTAGSGNECPLKKWKKAGEESYY